MIRIPYETALLAERAAANILETHSDWSNFSRDQLLDRKISLLDTLGPDSMPPHQTLVELAILQTLLAEQSNWRENP